jgi:hypothetical protein
MNVGQAITHPLQIHGIGTAAKRKECVMVLMGWEFPPRSSFAENFRINFLAGKASAWY